MITKIRYSETLPVEIVVENFGLAPGTYEIDELTADDLLLESRLLLAKRISMCPHDPQLEEQGMLEDCLARIIDSKCVGGVK